MNFKNHPPFRHGNKPTIGVLTGWQFYHTATNLSYLEPVYRGISRAAKDFHCNLLLGCGMGPSGSLSDPFRPAWPRAYADADFVPIGPWNTDALIIANPLHSPERSNYVQKLIQEGHPILFLGAGESGPAIVADNKGGILKAMEHLVYHGHKQIAFIAGSSEDMAGDSGARLRAYEEALKLYGLKYNPNLIAFGRHVYDGGLHAMEEILATRDPFTAVLASNDESAMGAMKALRNTGRNIPEDVAIIGFDNRPEGVVQVPALTSVHVPLFDIGYQAVDHLLQHLEQGYLLPERAKVETRLVLRGSCGCDLHQDLASIERATSREDFLKAVSEIIFSQVHSLTLRECQTFVEQLVASFSNGLAEKNERIFLQTLFEIMTHTAQQGNDAQVWQNAISFLRKGLEKNLVPYESVSASQINELFSEARLVISTYVEKQHRQYIIDERRSSSRLSLLTADLLTALDESWIHNTLKTHLPAMGIRKAYLAFFQNSGNDQLTLWDSIQYQQVADHFPSTDFPPEKIYSTGEPFQLTLIPLMDQAGQLGFMAFDTDHLEWYGSIVQQLAGALKTVALYQQATEGRRLAEEASRLKSRFLSTISHELRTPLNLIAGLSGILLQDSDESLISLPEQAQKDIERIHAYTQHLGGLIGDVLDLATSDAGRLRLNYEVVDLGQALWMVAASGSQLAADKGLSWKSSLPESGPWVMGDRTRLRQVALNLINNAIKFTATGTVSLSLETNGDEVTVYVKDTGLGIHPEEQARIFDEFHRSERSIKLGYTGLGVGLAISKRLIELHGGKIGVQSGEGEGTGSTFYFTLPAIPKPEIQTRSQSVPTPSHQNILVLTNDQVSGERFIQHLSKYAARVTLGMMDDVSDWQPKILRKPPDVIILDISVAPEVGWSSLSTIKANRNTRNIPVMFYKSSEEGESVLKFDYLTKPIDQNELTDAIDQYWAMSEHETDSPTILLVDDDQNTLEMHARIVQSHASSNRVLKALNGREAIDMLQREHVDLVLLDLQMPDIDGFTVLEAMRLAEKTRDIPVIVVTGKSLTESDMERLNRGVSVILGKGLFSVEETMKHIGEAFERKKNLSGDAQRLVRLAMAFMHEHFSDPISRGAISQHVGITEDYLTYCFRQELGTTPIRYLRRYRVNQAKFLLKNSDKSITEISTEVGFSDSSYFSRVFRREVGISPESYRMA